MDFPSSASDITQVTNTTNKDGFYRLNGSSAASYQTQLSNSDISGVDYTKINPVFANANKFLYFNSLGNIDVTTQSTTVNFSNITAWPEAYPSYKCVFADGTYEKVSNYNFFSSNSYDYAGNGKKLVYAMNYINSGI